MNWSGTSPIPDGDRVDPLPPELRAELGRRPHEEDHARGSNWIVAVAIVVILAFPTIALIVTH